MPRYTMRLFFALAISSSCYYGTIYWYNSQTSNVNKSKDKVAIATLSTHINDVQRKPLARVIWEGLSKDDTLYTGESIRTSSDSEARIVFLETGAILELEPDSQVVLEKNEKGAEIELLKGNLFVKSSSKGPSGLTLNSDQGKIDLSSANVSLSKSKKGAMDLQVFGGKAKLMQGGKIVELDKTKSGVLTKTGIKKSENIIKLISPTPGEPIYLDRRKKEAVTFKWEKLKPGYDVHLEIGRKRSKLKRLKKRIAAGESGFMRVPLKLGKFYWRLVAVPKTPDQEEQKSSVVPSEILAKVSPTPLEPIDKSKVVIKSTDLVKFKWATSIAYKNFYVEVATDKKLKNKILEKQLESTQNFVDLDLGKSGTYFWRVTGFMDIKGKSTPVSSLIQAFQLQKGIDLRPPVLTSPIANQRIPVNQVQETGVFLTWDKVPGVKKYKVHITKKKGKSVTKLVSNAFVKFSKLKPSQYEWYVTSVGSSNNKFSKPSEVRSFLVSDLPKIQWIGSAKEGEFLYATPKPYLKAEWGVPEGTTVSSWRVRYVESGFLDKDIKWIRTKKTQLRKWIDKSGEYDVEVEAVDAKGRVIARSEVATINVKEKPLLPAPQFESNLPEIIQASKRGQLNVKWDPIEGAEQYKVYIKDEKGKVVKETSVKRAVASVNRLKPGSYKVSVQAIDKHKRIGAESSERQVAVPDTSNIRAPKLKGFKVK